MPRTHLVNDSDTESDVVDFDDGVAAGYGDRPRNLRNSPGVNCKCSSKCYWNYYCWRNLIVGHVGITGKAHLDRRCKWRVQYVSPSRYLGSSKAPGPSGKVTPSPTILKTSKMLNSHRECSKDVWFHWATFNVIYLGGGTVCTGHLYETHSGITCRRKC